MVTWQRITCAFNTEFHNLGALAIIDTGLVQRQVSYEQELLEMVPNWSLFDTLEHICCV